MVDKPNPELVKGPGGVETPTPEPGPTPTPQEGLKPLGELLGQAKPLAEESVEEPSKEPPAPPEVPEPSPPPAERRIQQLTAEKWEERRRRESAEAARKLAEDTLEELAQLSPEIAQRLGRTPTGEASPTSQQTSKQAFTQAVQAEAQRLASEAEFNRRVDSAVLEGRKAHTDYDNAIADLKKITGPVVPGEFVMAALETGEASEIIYRLGKNPAEADRILSLPPIQQTVAVAQFAAGIKAAREATQELDKVSGAPSTAVSRAPAPIPPRVGGRKGNGELALDDPSLPLAEFIRRRDEEERKTRVRH